MKEKLELIFKNATEEINNAKSIQDLEAQFKAVMDEITKGI